MPCSAVQVGRSRALGQPNKCSKRKPPLRARQCHARPKEEEGRGCLGAVQHASSAIPHAPKESESEVFWGGRGGKGARLEESGVGRRRRRRRNCDGWVGSVQSSRPALAVIINQEKTLLPSVLPDLALCAGCVHYIGGGGQGGLGRRRRRCIHFTLCCSLGRRKRKE